MFYYTKYCVTLLSILYFFFSPTSHPIFRFEIFAATLTVAFVFSIYAYFYLKSDPKKILDLILFLVLLGLSAVKWGEYDPLRVLPEKASVKLTFLFWAVLLIYHFKKARNSESFTKLGSIIAIFPNIALTAYNPNAIVPVCLGLGYGLLPKDLSQFHFPKTRSKTFLVLILFILSAFISTWRGLDPENGLLQFYLFLIGGLVLVRGYYLDSDEKEKVLSWLGYVYYIQCLFFILKLSLDTGFEYNFNRSSFYHIPVSLLGANSAIFACLFLVQFIRKPTVMEKTYNAFGLGIALLFLGISSSRSSILMFICFAIFIFGILVRKKFKIHHLFLLILAVFILIFFSQFNDKKLINLDSINIRLMIWKFHITNTLHISPLFGFGLFPESQLLFLDTNPDSSSHYQTILDYVNEFKSFPVAHSLFIQLFSSLGMVGIILLVILLFLWIKKVLSVVFVQNERTHRYVLLGISLVWLIHEIFDFNSFEIPNLYAILLILGIGLDPKEDVEQIEPMEKKIFLVLLLGFASLFFYKALQWNETESYIRKWTKLYQTSNFEFFQYNSKHKFAHLPEEPVEIETWREYFLGKRYIHLQMARAKHQKSPIYSHYLTLCFNKTNQKAFCYSELYDLLNEEKGNQRLLPFIKAILSIHDPYKIYLSRKQ
ncbi:O-antigen ligase family protein [Leptospira ilyithenensis]|uniref:O-antigen ligase family protein n=1 Tax=Leptospira ilyithenensis TaxID=2484901 RepID=A0A4R9LQ21_9LEPT|nr:O-antigen ligase family protein [Leptospira ilyithenensis]TGN10076.1 O-antigen ligase family protein [Leptospira ilyithenensis]